MLVLPIQHKCLFFFWAECVLAPTLSCCFTNLNGFFPLSFFLFGCVLSTMCCSSQIFLFVCVLLKWTVYLKRALLRHLKKKNVQYATIINYHELFCADSILLLKVPGFVVHSYKSFKMKIWKAKEESFPFHVPKSLLGFVFTKLHICIDTHFIEKNQDWVWNWWLGAAEDIHGLPFGLITSASFSKYVRVDGYSDRQ